MNNCDCNEKKPQTSCGMTPEVVEIVNEDCPTLFHKMTIPASLGDDTGPYAPKNGAYKNLLVVYEANNHVYLYSSDGVYTLISEGRDVYFDNIIGRPKYAGYMMTSETDIPDVDSAVAAEAALRESADRLLQSSIDNLATVARTGKYSDLIDTPTVDTALDDTSTNAVENKAIATAITNESNARSGADQNLQSQIDAISASSDVTDIVGTYADLEAYDTTKLKDNDIIKVLQDETHDDETTYYRWSKHTEQFTLIGEEGPYYTKSAADTKFQDKLVAGTNITIDPSTNEISASTSGLSDSTTFWGRTASNGKVGGKLDVKYSENDTSYIAITPTNTHSMSITQTSGGNTHTLVNFGASNTPATFYEGINANNKKITNVATPTATTDAANKDYVDGLIPGDFTGTDGVNAGTHGLVPAPVAGDEDKALKGDGTWGDVSSQTIFYADLNETGTTRHIYKDISFATAASVQDIIDANDEGQVILRGTSTVNPTAYSDSYLQNSFIMPHNNDFEFVFLDRDLRYEYSASATTDTLFYYYTSEIQPKLTAGTNINISGTTISATDTTYSNFTGTDGVDAGTAGLVPAPTTTDIDKFLKSDGTWGTVSSGTTIPTIKKTDFMGASAGTYTTIPQIAAKLGIDLGTQTDPFIFYMYNDGTTDWGVSNNGTMLLPVRQNAIVRATRNPSNDYSTTKGWDFVAAWCSGRSIGDYDTGTNTTWYETKYRISYGNYAGTRRLRPSGTYNALDLSNIDYALSAAQGKVLNESKLAVANVLAGTGITVATAGSGANQTVTISATGGGGSVDTYTVSEFNTLWEEA